MLLNKQRHCFVLLELLIGMMLFILCIVPLIEIPVRSLKTQLHTITRASLPRYADLTFADVEVQLYQHLIPWQDLQSPLQKKHCLYDDSIKIGAESLQRKCFLFASSSKIDKRGQEHLLVTVEVILTHPTASLFPWSKKDKHSQTFTYQTYVKK